MQTKNNHWGESYVIKPKQMGNWHTKNTNGGGDTPTKLGWVMKKFYNRKRRRMMNNEYFFDKF